MQFDAIRFFDDFNIPYYTEGKNSQDGWAQVDCPFCNDERGLGFNLSADYCTCWRSHWHPLDEALSLLTGFPISEIETLKKRYLSDYTNLMTLNKKRVNFAEKVKLPGRKLNKYHKKYLKRRNFDPDYLEEKYHLLGTESVGYWKYRIIIPIYLRKQLISFQGRDYTQKQELRYLGCKKENAIMDYKDSLYGIDFCTSDSIAVVEGVTDVWRMGDGFAATFGTSMTENQIRLLSKYNNIYFLFDPELEAQEKALKVAKKLASIGRNAEVIDLEIDCDPGDLSDEDVLKIRKDLGF